METRYRPFLAGPRARTLLAGVLFAWFPSACAADPAPGPPGPEPFRIEAQWNLEELQALAAEASPPREEGKLPADLVNLRRIGHTATPELYFDIRYATRDNFLGLALYDSPEAWCQRPVAEALLRVAHELRSKGHALLIHDALRPWRVTKMFWDATPEHQRAFVADPRLGSRHNRGCAIDLTLCDPQTGEPRSMPSGYDEFSERASPDYTGGTPKERAHRDLLRRAMESEGFRVYANEWWHFDFEGWEQYGLELEFPGG